MNSSEIFELLSTINDPEIPVISIAELGILRSVEQKGKQFIIRITPTYSGCPAMNMIENNINFLLNKNGIQNAVVETVYSPAWTTDWLTESAKDKLKKYGIAAPGKINKLLSLSGDRAVECPNCGSKDVKLVSEFGSTACKALYKCNNCMEPFDLFKCH
jgi:ring-1,2-phenylacetyl-CoA epoxidase subunit PaaD